MLSNLMYYPLPRLQTLMTLSQSKFKGENCITNTFLFHNLNWSSCLSSPKNCSYFLPPPSVYTAASRPFHYVHSCLKQFFHYPKNTRPTYLDHIRQNDPHLTFVYFSAFSFTAPSVKREPQGKPNCLLFSKASSFILQSGLCECCS